MGSTMWPQPDDGPHLEPVKAADFEALAGLRIRAMRPSLEALGRFDPERARQRLADTFEPAVMRHLVAGGQRVGVVTLKPLPDALDLVHLYIEPAHQRAGLGTWALDVAKARADELQLPLTLGALKGSDAHRFYRRHGFVEQAQGEWDVQYRREPQARPRAVVQALWAAIDARDWPALRALLHDDAAVRWWASAERLATPEAFVTVQAVYPEGWSIHPMGFDTLDDGRVLAFVRVEHPPHGTYLVQQTVRVRDGRVAQADELWATCEAPPAWRTPERIPGLERLA